MGRSFWKDGPTRKRFVIVWLIFVLVFLGGLAWLISNFVEKYNEVPTDLELAVIEINKSFPIDIEPGVQLDHALSEDRALIFVFVVDGSDEPSLLSDYSQDPTAEELNELCSLYVEQPVFSVLNVYLEYRYISKSGEILNSTKASKGQCDNTWKTKFEFKRINKKMNLELYKLSQQQEIVDLYTSVFTDSEGESEGKLIGKLVSELQETTDKKDIYGFVAKDGKSIVGCIFFTRMSFDNPIISFILSPVAVLTSIQKQGLGQKLINFGINYLKEKKVELLLTYGDPNYYSKVGFKPVAEKIIPAPLKLTYPEGWLAQSLKGDEIPVIKGSSACVKALSDQNYW